MSAEVASVIHDLPRLYEGNLASLRPVGRDDAGTLLQWRADLEAFHLLAVPEGVSTEEEYTRHWEATLQRTITLLAVSEPDGQPIGVVQAYDVNLADGWCFVLSYVTPEYRSQRVGLEATVGFWDYLFTQMNLRKIYMDVVESNTGWLRGVPGLEIGLFHEEGRFFPGGFIHLDCRRAYFETDDVLEPLLHFSPALSDDEREELRRACAAEGPSAPG